MIRLDNLSKRFPIRRGWLETLRHPRSRDYVCAAQGICLEVREGECFGILGPNGAGKTTLFKMLATMVAPDAGSATVGGLDVGQQGEAVRRILATVITEERSLYWRLSALENLRLFATLHGLQGVTARRRVSAALATTGLADTGDRMVGTFSSGMKHRVMIARALLAEPRVLLLDEPTRSLDPIAARDLRLFLRQEIKELKGCTLVLATHNPEEAVELCDRVAVLDRGRVLAVGSARELAREVGGEWYCVVTRTPQHAIFDPFERTGKLRRSPAESAAGEWSQLELEVPGGHEQAAAILGRLIEAGVPVASFERVQLPLAALIERVVARNARESAHA